MATAVNRPKQQQNKATASLNVKKVFSGWMGYFTMVAVCGLVYIANLHYADRNIRTLNRLRKEVAELRAEYTILRAQFITSNKRGVIKAKVSQLGLVESNTPAYDLKAE
ncbi:MAG: FtsL-like putative cell division protein [Cytophagales bacterium]|nr:FtsL-like putative cell division protein [Bernardetiaceae bacterium]MDW8211668.1 FtsL-like putative cell division protein [Cytophagales bacterium]